MSISNVGANYSVVPQKNQPYADKSDLYRLTKAWFNFYQNHRGIPPEQVISLPNTDAKPYRVFIPILEGLRFQTKTLEATGKYVLKLTMHFFSKPKLKFYGRSYVSSAIELVLNKSTSSLETVEPLNVYFYSKLGKETDNNNILIAEALIIELTDLGGAKYQELVGWADLEVFHPVEGVKKSSFNQGTCRELTNATAWTNKVPLSTNISYTVLSCEPLLHVENLLDESMLCGSDEILPGVVSRKLPNSTDEKVIVTKEKSFTVEVFNIQVNYPQKLENEVLANCKTFRNGRFNISDEESKNISDVYIGTRELAVIFHNGWTAVNSNRFKNFVLLQGDPKTETFTYKGTQPLDNVFIDEYGVIVFQLELLVVLPLPQLKRSEQRIIVGWAPYFLENQKFGLSNISLKENLLKGKGFSIDGERLFRTTLSDQELVIVSANLNLSNIPRTSSLANTQQDYAQQDNRNLTKDPKFDESFRAIMLEKQRAEQEKERLMRENEILRMQAQNQPNQQLQSQQPTNQLYQPPSEDMWKKYNEIAEMTVRKEILATRDETLREHERSQQELNTIRNAVLDIQKQLQSKADEDRFERQKKERELETLKKLESDLYGKFDLSKVKNLDVVTNVPRYNLSSNDMAFVAQPDQYTRELSRADKALLLQAGVKGLLDRHDDAHMYDELPTDQAVQKEINTSLKASNFLIQFLAIRPSQFAVAEDALQKAETSQDKFILPKRVHFTLSFFDFPNYKSDSAALEKSESSGPSDYVLHGIPYYLVRESYARTGGGSKELLLKYEIDPSLEYQKNQHIEFAKYLISKSVHIDIWDADSLMLFGSVKVPLRGLLRHGKEVTSLSKEFEIIEPNFMRVKGGLQLLLKNIGKEPVKPVVEIKTKAHPRGTTPDKLGSHSKKKVKSKGGIDLPKEIQQQRTATITHFDQDAINNEELRKQERINRYKMATIDYKGNITDDGKDKGAKYLREVTNFRDTKKPMYLKNILHHHYEDEKHLNVSFGKVEIFSIEVTNYFEFEEAFTVIIDDPDAKFLAKPELTVVSNASEWKYWVENRGFQRPPEWNMISPTDNNFLLRSGEKIEIILKYLTTRTFDESTESKKKGEVGLANLRDIENRKQTYISPRGINVTISQLKGRVVSGLKVNVEPHAPIIDHVFRYFEQENKTVTLYLPTLYASSLPPTQKPILALTNPKAVVDWLNDKEISLQLKVGSAQSVTKFNLLAYGDSYKSELLANWLIEVHSFAGIDLSVNIGQLTTTKLTLPADLTRNVKCYSSHPGLVQFPSPYDKSFTLAPGTINTLSVNVRSFSVKSQSVQINCVDVNSRELVYAWILRVHGSEPRITKVFDVECRVGKESTQRFPYENRSANWCLFEFVSSHPHVLQPFERTTAINPGEKEDIRIKLAKQNDPGLAEVCLYVSDTEEKVFDCLLFKIKYTY